MKIYFAKSTSLIIGVVFVMFVACFTISGQSGTSTIRGTVTDPQGNVVAGASVTLASAEKNFSRTVVTGCGYVQHQHVIDDQQQHRDDRSRARARRQVNQSRKEIADRDALQHSGNANRRKMKIRKACEEPVPTRFKPKRKASKKQLFRM